MMIKGKSFATVSGLISTLRSFVRAVLIPSNVELGLQMKELNNKKDFKSALSLFNMYKQIEMNDLAINQALQACVHLRDSQCGLSIYKQLSSRSLKCRHIQTSLVQLFTRCGDVKLAQHILSSVPPKQRTPFLYTAMINGLIRNNRNEDALTLFEQMTIVPDAFILTIIFTVCATLSNDRSIRLGREIFSSMSRKYLQNTVVMNAALNMFSKFGDIDKAKELFASIKSKDVISYGAMMKGHCLNDNPLEALNLLTQMKKDNIKPDEIIYVLAVRACSQTAMIEYCQSIVDEIPKHFLKDHILQNSLIDMWGKAGLIDKAKNVFQTIENPDSVSFGAMINAFGQNGMGLQAVDLYNRIPAQMGNNVINLCVLNACSHSGLVDAARLIFNEISPKSGMITTAMIDCLSRMHRFDEAEKLLLDFEEVHPPYLPMYLAIMSGARNRYNSNLSNKLFLRVKKLFPEQKEDLLSASILLANTCFSADESDQSRNLRKEVSESPVRRQVVRSWTCVNGQIHEFRAHDRSHHQSEEIYREIDILIKELVQFGHKFDSRWITRRIGKCETIESVLSGHSERLAFAYNLIQEKIRSPIQITQNLRICGDCHSAIKLITRIRQRQIIIRDANRIHHFQTNGECSCGDFF